MSLSLPRLLLARESWDNSAPFLPLFEIQQQSPQSIARAFLENPGRFCSPLSWREKTELELFALSASFDFFGLSKYFFPIQSRFDIPYPWQVLLRYLKREGVLQGEGVRVAPNFFDVPMCLICTLDGKSSAHITSKDKGVLLPIESFFGGQGTTPSLPIALSKAVGELLERSFLAVPTEDTFEASLSSLRKTDKRFLHPASLSHFSETQKDYCPEYQIKDMSQFSWVEGKNLLTNRTVLLPTQAVFWQYHVKGGEPYLRQPTTNGAAGHFTREEAILSALYENIERDGFLLYWLNAIPPTRIDTSTLQDKELRALLVRLERYHFEVVFLNTTTDIGTPSILCVLIDRSDQGPKVAVGGGCGWEVERLMRETLIKTIATYRSARTLAFKTIPTLPQNYLPFSDQTIGFEARMALWQNPAMFRYIEPWLTGPLQSIEATFHNLPSFANKQAEYEAAIERFQTLGSGYEMYVYERKHPVLTKLGYHVVKVIVPELIPMYLNESRATLGSKRLRSVPPKLGQSIPSTWNPWPHPFP